MKSSFTNLHPDFIAFMRMVVAFLCFLPFFKRTCLPVKEGVKFFLIGSVQYGFMYLCLNRSYGFLQGYEVAMYTAFTPLYVSILSSIFSRKAHVFYLVMASFSVVIGSFFYMLEISLEKSHWMGIVFVQLADLCFAWGQVAYKALRRKTGRELVDHNIYALLFLGGLFLAACSTTYFGGWKGMNILSLSQGISLLYLGAIASGLCFFWWNKASVFTNSGILAVANNAKIPCAICFSLLFFQEKGNLIFAGFSFVSMGVMLFFMRSYVKKIRRKELSAYF